MSITFFKNSGPFKISKILEFLDIKHDDINKDYDVFDIKDLFTSGKIDITFFHS